MKKRKDGRWAKRVTLPDGKSKFFYSTANTEREAIKDFNNQMLRFQEKMNSAGKFLSVAERWNDEYREKVSDINYRKNARAAYERIVDFFKSYDVSQVTVREINLFINQLIANGFYKKTIAAHKSILNMIFQHAMLNGYVNYNPVSDLRLPSNLPVRDRELPSTEEIKIVDSHYTDFDLLPYFLLYTGLRISEALALSYEDVDFEKKIIKIEKHLLHDNNRPVIEQRTKTKNSKRTVVLLDRLADKLPRNKNGLIFGNPDGSPYTKGQLRKRWEKYQKIYGVTLTAHQLRHAYATMLFEAGIDVKDAQELMGHSDINLTRQIYTHIKNERKEETARKLNDFQF